MSEPDLKRLKSELFGLFNYVRRIRGEIAAIKAPETDSDYFVDMADQLDAIVGGTERATDEIMENAETIDSVVQEVLDKIEDPNARAKLAGLSDNVSAIFEACSFQDITGQRVTKVVKSVKFIEERMNALIAVWGEAQIAETKRQGTKPEPKGDAALLHGPQLDGQGIDQTEVDNLMGDPKPPFTPPQQSEKSEQAGKPKAAAQAKPAAAKPAAPAGKAAPPAAKEAPAVTPAEPNEEEGDKKLSQDDVDKLFG